MYLLYPVVIFGVLQRSEQTLKDPADNSEFAQFVLQVGLEFDVQ
jgi:hypothetical protein